jgi:transposase
VANIECPFRVPLSQDLALKAYSDLTKEQVVDFLKALVRHLDQPLLIVCDRLPGHRSRLVQDYIVSLQGWISTAYLPPYAPELNPVEYIWGYWKQHELPNVCPKD